MEGINVLKEMAGPGLGVIDFLICVGVLALIGFVGSAISHYLGELFPFIWGDWEQRDRALLEKTQREGEDLK